MSKKTNTLWFILGATAFNILTTIICAVLLFVLYGQILRYFPVSEAAIGWGIPVIIIGAIVLSFFLYRFVLKLIIKKVDLEKYFDPIFGRRKK
jgi:hypothetical protein